MPHATKLIHLKQYDSLALKTFLRNLPERLQDKIILQKPDCLETAMSLVIDDENFRRTRNLTTTYNKPQPQPNFR